MPCLVGKLILIDGSMHQMGIVVEDDGQDGYTSQKLRVEALRWRGMGSCCGLIGHLKR